jgi:SHS2 domain-containing protein
VDEGFRATEHTADLGLEVWAPTPERLYALAAVALAAQEVDAGSEGGTLAVPLVLDGDDPADLLVHWLNTSLLESSLRDAVWTAAEIHALGPRGLSATLRGPRKNRARHTFLREIKAVSHHALELDLTPGRCRCRLILDL